jgi:glycosyltransferase involved in cell wall biosynthesis
MKSLDLFVLPSLEEGLPVALLEAMSCALPIIASDVGGVRALIHPGETGLLVPPAEVWNRERAAEQAGSDGVAALAEAIAALLGDGARAGALARAAREFVERSLTVEQTVARLEQLYAECLGRRGRLGGVAAGTAAH